MVADRDRSLKSGSRDVVPFQPSGEEKINRRPQRTQRRAMTKWWVVPSTSEGSPTRSPPLGRNPPFHALRVVPPWPPVFHLTSFGSTVTASGTTPGPRGAERCVVCCPIDYTMSLLGDMLARFAGSVEIRGKPGIGSNHIHHSRLRAARNVRRRVGNIGCS